MAISGRVAWKWQRSSARAPDGVIESGFRDAQWGVTSIHLMNNGKSVSTTLVVFCTLKLRQKWTLSSLGD